MVRRKLNQSKFTEQFSRENILVSLLKTCNQLRIREVIKQFVDCAVKSIFIKLHVCLQFLQGKWNNKCFIGCGNLSQIRWLTIILSSNTLSTCYGHPAQSPFSFVIFHNVILFQCYFLYFNTLLARYTEVNANMNISIRRTVERNWQCFTKRSDKVNHVSLNVTQRLAAMLIGCKHIFLSV